MHYGPNNPAFPQTKLAHDENQSFKPAGLEPECWSTATPIRKIFREAFESAGLPYFNPHLFRNTLAHIGQQTCKTPEQMKAWSQNLGHENVLTTFTSYGNLDPHRQGEVIKGLSDKGHVDDNMAAIMAKLEAIEASQKKNT